MLKPISRKAELTISGAKPVPGVKGWPATPRQGNELIAKTEGSSWPLLTGTTEKQRSLEQPLPIPFRKGNRDSPTTADLISQPHIDQKGW